MPSTLMLLIFVILAAGAANAASDTGHWIKLYGGSGNDAFNQIINTSDGGYAVTGYSDSSGGNISNVWLVKADPNGTEQWNRTYGGKNSSVGNSIVQMGDGGFAIAGFTTSGNNGSRVTYLLRTDRDGNEMWERTFGTAPCYAMYITRLPNDSLVIAGVTYVRGSIASGYLIQTDKDGNETWEKLYGGARKNEAHYVAETVDGGFIIAGYTQSYGDQNGDYFVNGTGDAWLIKTDVAGNELWNRTYGGDSYDDSYAVLQTADGGYLLGGTTKSYSKDNAMAYVVKTDASGNELWNRTFGQNASDSVYSMLETTNGYILTGTSYPPDDKSKVFLLKINKIGNIDWGYSYGYVDDFYGYSVTEGPEGDYLIAGSTIASEFGGIDGLILAVFNNGTAMVMQDNNSTGSGSAGSPVTVPAILLILIVIASVGICAGIAWKWILKK